MARWLRHSADFDAFPIAGRDIVLDVGCGTGNASRAAGMRGAEVIAVDVDPEAIRQTTEALRGVPARAFQALQTAGNPLPIPDETASAIICTEVLEHVDDPESFVAELARVGQPHARYVFSVPDPRSEALMAIVAPPNYFERPGHQRIFRHVDFHSLIQNAGLDVVAQPVYPNGSYWTMFWTLRWATGEMEFGPGSTKPPPPVLAAWSRVWQILESSSRGRLVIDHLDTLLPKSQVVVARKRSGCADIEDQMGRLSKIRSAPEPTEQPCSTATNSFYEEMSDLLRWSVRSNDPRASEVVALWDEVWNTLVAAPQGGRVVEQLNTWKLCNETWLRCEADEGLTRTRRWKRFFKEGSIGLGGYRVHWSIRRSHEHQPSF